MGIVHQALDTALDRTVALKELPLHLTARADLARRFRQEARLLARLSHSNIVQVYDLIDDGNRLWIAMEFIDGGTLADAIERSGALAPMDAVRLGGQLAAGLGFAHAQGVIHRDIKPINVLITRDGIPKLTDFGLAKLLESSVHTQAGSLLGSARYMSPEQAAGGASDERSDVYSLGVTFYEMLSGRTPFEGETASVLAQHLSQEPLPLGELVRDLPADFEALVMRMLEKDPERRPGDLDAVALALSSLDPGSGSGVPRSSGDAARREGSRRPAG
jgi:serine/threonine protein kinase